MGLLCLLLLLLMITGVPVPRSSHKDCSSPFPCMFSQCGCMTAEQCWRSCCCHSLEEKLAWARKQGVTPPDYVLDQARDQGIDFEQEVASSAEPACDCCSKDNSKKQVHDTERGLVYVVSLRALKCQGQDGWMLLASTMMPVTIFEVECTGGCCETLSLEQVFLLNICLVLDHPPPRF
jgi:hypothetical protein